MRLTIYTDYGLRTLVYLATYRERVCTVGEIAQSYGISKHHLMKVAQDLAAAGFVEAVRGKGGGLRLARAPHQIGVGEVVRHTEGDMHLVNCFDPSGKGCSIESACSLQGALSEALAAFLKVLDRYTIADLMNKRRQLAHLFGIPIVVAPRKVA